MVEEALSLVRYNGDPRTRTLEMRLQFIFLELDAYLRDLRANAKLTGPRTYKYHEFFARDLEEKLKAIQNALPTVNYLEVD